VNARLLIQGFKVGGAAEPEYHSRKVALGIAIDKDDLLALFCEHPTEIEGCGRLADAALVVEKRNSQRHRWPFLLSGHQKQLSL
jgi:hypothetical protein